MLAQESVCVGESCEPKFVPMTADLYCQLVIQQSQGVLSVQEIVTHADTTVTSLWNQIPRIDWAHISKYTVPTEYRMMPAHMRREEDAS